MKQYCPKGWAIEETGGGCQWLRKGCYAITDGDAGVPDKRGTCMLFTLDKNGNADEGTSFGSVDAALAFLASCELNHSRSGPTKFWQARNLTEEGNAILCECMVWGKPVERIVCRSTLAYAEFVARMRLEGYVNVNAIIPRG